MYETKNCMDEDFERNCKERSKDSGLDWTNLVKNEKWKWNNFNYYTGSANKNYMELHVGEDWLYITTEWMKLVFDVHTVRKQVWYSLRRAPTSVLSYGNFKKLKSIVPDMFRVLIQPSFFLEFSRDPGGNISCLTFLTSILNLAFLNFLVHRLRKYEKGGYIYESELISFLADCLKCSPGPYVSLSVIVKMESTCRGIESFYQKYMCRRLFFCLDRFETGRISFKHFIASEEFKCFAEGCLSGSSATNPWSPACVLSIYQTFIDCGYSTSMNSLLPFLERLATSTNQEAYFVTSVFLERVFEEYSTSRVIGKSNVSELKLSENEFLNMLFSLEYLAAYGSKDNFNLLSVENGGLAAINWIWNILDYSHVGSIDYVVIKKLWEGMISSFNEILPSYTLPDYSSLQNELTDMIQQTVDQIIMKKDFLSRPRDACRFSLKLVNVQYVYNEIKNDLV